ncbi:hypothetical protein F4V72_07185 [Salmonella enterica subsp. diarizonae]|uniref:hypothetical protein n=1 Tax=Salmonella enterica TaxID=28901 RepID=UPI00109CB6D3|nr:hypothetical protein [Salmonella enterica]ECH9341124.1 hypothetical protein [Salmonella enterica subsp. diarizonae]EDU9901801.1 hypothetical protein [Salmonella enterica subsp. diarizonae]KAA8690754.1 hypothetical protein F4V72_07185 [Salmonella enterica subsp. diarizonae]VFS65109.1 Uncharacterised protein [Salmonella enterica subsp. diarizonae]HAU3296162.1 hypothetical protein [Salmonella enterica subsp. diarizonae]
MGRRAKNTIDVEPMTPAIPGQDFEHPYPELSQEDIQAQGERDLLNQLLGQAQMADAFGKFSRTVRTSKLAFIKENKLYRHLKGNKTPHGAEFSGTWEGFCELLGSSVDQVDRDITNLRTFGEEALESMSRMGIGYRELRQFRKLPEDSKTALIEVAKQGDKESLLDLAEELIARQNDEKEQLAKQLADTEADLEASRKRAADLKSSRDELEDKLHEERFKPITDNELAERTRLEATSISSKIARELMGALQGAFAELEKDTADRGVDHSSFMAGLVCEIRSELDDIVTRFSIPDMVAEVTPPAWVNDNTEEE